MEAYIKHENGNYIVCIRVEDTDGVMRFKPFVNFGERQSDAMDMRDLCKEDLINDDWAKRRVRQYCDADKYKLVLNTRKSIFEPIITKQL